MKKTFAAIAVFLLLSGGSVIASRLIATDHIHDDGTTTSHSGRTNAEGCHNDYKKGTYHCH